MLVARDVVHDAKTHKLFKGTPVIDLKFKIFNRKLRLRLR
jgi:hypothetical protein